MCSYFNLIPVVLLWIRTSKSMSLIKHNQPTYFMDVGTNNYNDVSDFIITKKYLPDEKDLPKSSIVKNVDNDVTYLLSKLSDEELIKLLNDQPKKNFYDLNDIVKVAAVDVKSVPDKNMLSEEQNKPQDIFYPNSNNNRFKTVSSDNDNKDVSAFFRLDNKRVEPYNIKSDSDPNYMALEKLNNMLYSHPQEDLEKSEEEDQKRELLFDVLVAQLKTLCCKKSKSKSRDGKKNPYKTMLEDIISPDSAYPKSYAGDQKQTQAKLDSSSGANEYMFLIINDEIKGNGSEELISVDPESLEKNSSVLLLGPITSPLSNGQLKSVMSRISNELSKPDYLPLLQQISDGTLSGSNVRLMKSLVTGPETRRYIKPHRCNHHTPFAKIYDGPKWIVCTGYLNLNRGSVYD